MLSLKLHNLLSLMGCPQVCFKLLIGFGVKCFSNHLSNSQFSDALAFWQPIILKKVFLYVKCMHQSKLAECPHITGKKCTLPLANTHCSSVLNRGRCWLTPELEWSWHPHRVFSSSHFDPQSQGSHRGAWFDARGCWTSGLRALKTFKCLLVAAGSEDVGAQR